MYTTPRTLQKVHPWGHCCRHGVKTGETHAHRTHHFQHSIVEQPALLCKISTAPTASVVCITMSLTCSIETPRSGHPHTHTTPCRWFRHISVCFCKEKGKRAVDIIRLKEKAPRFSTRNLTHGLLAPAPVAARSGIGKCYGCQHPPSTQHVA